MCIRDREWIAWRNRAHRRVGESGDGVERLMHFSSMKAYVRITPPLDPHTNEIVTYNSI